MNKFLTALNTVIANAPKIKYYAALVIQVVDMLDGVKDWQIQNKPEAAPVKKK